MNNILFQPISKKQILDDKEISWTIKYDLLNADEVFKVNIDECDFNYKSQKIKEIRKFNKENYPIKRYIFNLYSNKMFYTITHIKPLIIE